MSGSLIEKASLRLEQLRQAGVEVAPAKPESATAVKPEATPAPAPSQGVSRRVEIDLAALTRAGIVTPNAPRSEIADQFRVIKRPLISNAQGKGASLVASGNLIMVTSALPAEGKTFVAINLAMSIATEMDCTVMLVDADVARPSVMNVLGLPASPGLLDLVATDSTDVAPYLLKTNVDKLTILPSGTPHHRATELLTTEARVLATHVGQVVVVVGAEQTLQSDVTQALSLIANCPVRLMLLNRARITANESYGYGNGYGT